MTDIHYNFGQGFPFFLFTICIIVLLHVAMGQLGKTSINGMEGFLPLASSVSFQSNEPFPVPVELSASDPFIYGMSSNGWQDLSAIVVQKQSVKSIRDVSALEDSLFNTKENNQTNFNQTFHDTLRTNVLMILQTDAIKSVFNQENYQQNSLSSQNFTINELSSWRKQPLLYDQCVKCSVNKEIKCVPPKQSLLQNSTLPSQKTENTSFETDQVYCPNRRTNSQRSLLHQEDINSSACSKTRNVKNFFQKTESVPNFLSSNFSKNEISKHCPNLRWIQRQPFESDNQRTNDAISALFDLVVAFDEKKLNKKFFSKVKKCIKTEFINLIQSYNKKRSWQCLKSQVFVESLLLSLKNNFNTKPEYKEKIKMDPIDLLSEAQDFEMFANAADDIIGQVTQAENMFAEQQYDGPDNYGLDFYDDEEDELYSDDEEEEEWSENIGLSHHLGRSFEPTRTPSPTPSELDDTHLNARQFEEFENQMMLDFRIPQNADSSTSKSDSEDEDDLELQIVPGMDDNSI